MSAAKCLILRRSLRRKRLMLTTTSEDSSDYICYEIVSESSVR